jgi:hypothetical protein
MLLKDVRSSCVRVNCVRELSIRHGSNQKINDSNHFLHGSTQICCPDRTNDDSARSELNLSSVLMLVPKRTAMSKRDSST